MTTTDMTLSEALKPSMDYYASARRCWSSCGNVWGKFRKDVALHRFLAEGAASPPAVTANVYHFNQLRIQARQVDG